jgi:hypothetical protein
MTRPLSELPNREGFRFIACFKDGREAACILKWNGPAFIECVCQVLVRSELSGWLPECDATKEICNHD